MTATVQAPALLVRAIQMLAGVCDGANLRDGQGFNARDTYLGHQLAALPAAEWGPAEIRWGWEAARKYRRQLVGMGIDHEAIAEPPVVKLTLPNGREGRDWHDVRYHERIAKRQQEQREAQERLNRQQSQNRDLQRQRDIQRQRQAETENPKFIVDVGDNTVWVSYPFDYATKDLVKASVRGIYYDGATRRWLTKITEASAPSLLELARVHRFDLRGDLGERLGEIAGRAARLEAASHAFDAEFEVEGLALTLRPFQKAGVRYAVQARRTFIADEPGLGKTCQAIATLHHLGEFPAVVVTPSSVKFNWRREWQMWLPGIKVVVIEGTKPFPDEYYRYGTVYVVNYDILGAHAEQLHAITKPRAVVCDESHYLKNAKTARYQAVQILMGIPVLIKDKATKTQHYLETAATGVPVNTRLLLSGTPILNRPIELLPQLKLIDMVRPVATSEYLYMKRYCQAHKDAYGKMDKGGAANGEELNRLLRQNCYIRRKKIDVLTELPPKTRSIVDVSIDNPAEYAKAEADLIRWLMLQAANDEAFLLSIAHLSAAEQQHLRLERASSVAKKAQQAEQLVRINVLKQLAVKGKMKAIKNWVADFLETGEKLVVFAWYREVVLEICRELEALHGKPIPHIMGGDSAARREEVKQQFQNDPDTRLVVCNIVAAGEGITLTAASNTFFAELGWNPGKHDQAEDRVHRIGQESDNVTAWYMLSQGTIEGWIFDMIQEKRVVTTAVNQGETVEQEQRVAENMATQIAMKLLEMSRAAA